MEKYKLSIIIPTFNLEYKIEKAFRSIQNQTLCFENIEIIFVDDQSSDRTVKLLNNYASKFENVFLYSTEENSGFAGKPRNIGLENATSDFVMFLDGDDALLKNSCEILYNKIYYDMCDIVIGGQINVFNGIYQHNPPLFYSEERTFKNPIDIELLNIAPAITAKIFKRQFLKENEIRFLEGIPGQDLVFILEALLNSKKTVTLNDFYVYFRNVSHSSVSFNTDEKYLYGLIDAYEIVCDLLNKFNVPFEIQEVIFARHLGFFTTQILRASSENKNNNESIPKILNSEPFKKLSNKHIFRNNAIFKQYFNNMHQGNYDNHKLIKKVLEDKKLSYYEELIEDKNQLTRKNNELTDLNSRLNSENIDLNNINSKLSDERTKLTDNISDLKVTNSKLNEDITVLKDELTNMKKQETKVIDENYNLKQENNAIIKQKNDLQKELNNIKSSKLWRLKNKF